MKFNAKQSRNCTIASGKQKDVRFTIAGENIPPVNEEPVKSLGRWCKDGLIDRHKGEQIYTTKVKEV